MPFSDFLIFAKKSRKLRAFFLRKERAYHFRKVYSTPLKKSNIYAVTRRQTTTKRSTIQRKRVAARVYRNKTLKARLPRLLLNEFNRAFFASTVCSNRKQIKYSRTLNNLLPIITLCTTYFEVTYSSYTSLIYLPSFLSYLLAKRRTYIIKIIRSLYVCKHAHFAVASLLLGYFCFYRTDLVRYVTLYKKFFNFSIRQELNLTMLINNAHRISQCFPSFLSRSSRHTSYIVLTRFICSFFLLQTCVYTLAMPTSKINSSIEYKVIHQLATNRKFTYRKAGMKFIKVTCLTLTDIERNMLRSSIFMAILRSESVTRLYFSRSRRTFHKK